MSISAFGLSSCLSNSFVMLLIHSAFLLCSLACDISVQNLSVSLVSGCWYVFVTSPTICWIFFRYFGMSCFVCIVLLFVDIFLIFLFSPVLFGLFSQVLLLFILCYLFCVIYFMLLILCYLFCVTFLSQHVPAFFLIFIIPRFIILTCFHRFLFAFSVEIFLQGLIFASCFFRALNFLTNWFLSRID